MHNLTSTTGMDPETGQAQELLVINTKYASMRTSRMYGLAMRRSDAFRHQEAVGATLLTATDGFVHLIDLNM